VVAVAVAAGDGLAAAGDGRPAHRQKSWESHASFHSSDKAAETNRTIVGLLWQLLRDLINEVLINAALIIVRLCHCWVHTKWVDLSVNHDAGNLYLSGLNLWRGKTKIDVESTKYICACIVNHAINVSCIALVWCSSSWTKPWRDPKLPCFPGRLIMVNGHCSEGNECRADFNNRWAMIHSNLSYAIEVYPVNMIHILNRCKLKLGLLNWLMWNDGYGWKTQVGSIDTLCWDMEICQIYSEAISVV